MAKRRAAEPLTFHVPWKRLLLCDFPEEPPPPPLWIPPPGASYPGRPLGFPELPRKRKIDAGAMTEPSVSPSKRRDDGDTGAQGGAEREGRGLETGESQLLQPPVRPRGPGVEPRGVRPPRGGGDDGAGRAQPQRGDWGAAPRQVGAGGGLGAPTRGGGRGRGRGERVTLSPALRVPGRNLSSPSKVVFVTTLPLKMKSWGPPHKNVHWQPPFYPHPTPPPRQATHQGP